MKLKELKRVTSSPLNLTENVTYQIHKFTSRENMTAQKRSMTAEGLTIFHTADTLTEIKLFTLTLYSKGGLTMETYEFMFWDEEYEESYVQFSKYCTKAEAEKIVDKLNRENSVDGHYYYVMA